MSQSSGDRRSDCPARVAVRSWRSMVSGPTTMLCDCPSCGRCASARDPRGKFGERKGFDQIIIGAAAKARELVVERVARGEHEDRNPVIGAAADLGAYAQPVAPRQREVEQHDIDGAHQGLAHPRLTVGGVMEPMPQRLEIVDDVARQIGVVLDQQDVECLVQAMSLISRAQFRRKSLAMQGQNSVKTAFTSP